MNFTPPDDAIPVWASYIPGRRPEFKTYTKRHHALSSVSIAGRGIIYYIQGDKWIEWKKIEYEKSPGKCDNCGGNYPSRVWIDLKTDNPFMGWLCLQCNRGK